MTEHLQDAVIATLAEREHDSDHSEAIAHLGECSECRARLVAVTNLLDDDAIVEEVNALDPAVKRIAALRWSPARWAAVATLAAAAVVAIVITRPNKSPRESVTSPVNREATVTTTAPPRIISPPTISMGESLRWTSVRGADLYRVQVWDREGDVVFTTDTRDTTLLLPPAIASGGSYLWEVKARTGWDRWASSDFLEMNVKPHTP
ncbi:MAG: hypothetical protein ABR582_11360 [Gemmatimonadaceae bacterium]